MNDTEESARHLFAAAAEDVPPGIDLLRGVQARRRARRVRTRALLAVGTAGIVTAAGTITLSAVRAPSASAQVTRAAARTAEESYRVRSAAMMRIAPGSWEPQVRISGEFDPARGVGEATTNHGLQIRYIGSYLYLPVADAPWVTTRIPAGKTWLRIPMPQGGHVAGALTRLSASPMALEQLEPQDLLALLESASQVQAAGPASGPGWTGSAYAFTADTGYAYPGHTIVTARGTVDVDQQGRVRQVDVVQSVQRIQWKVDVAFGDFGVKVSVSTPPASETFTLLND